MITLAKAELAKIDSALAGTGRVTVLTCPINPESLKITYSNQIEPAKADEKGGAGGAPATPPAAAGGGQFVSKMGTKLSVTLVLDVAVPGAGGVTDVRDLTARVIGLLTPDPATSAPPGVELLWGAILFRGYLESVDESLEFFSPDGVALRATLALSITRPVIQSGVKEGYRPPGRGGAGGAAPGTVPLAEARAGASLQGLIAGAGVGGGAGLTAGASWQAVATANNIDDPLRLKAGQRLDLGLAGRVRVGG